jgi:hypothetical protein
MGVGYPVDSAGTMTVWSAMYLLVNGWKRTLWPAVRVRAIGPALMGGKALFDTGVNGWYWLNTRRWEETEGP